MSEVVQTKEKHLQKILSDLEKAGKGYNLTVHKYKFEEYGIPQASLVKKELNLN